LQSNTAIFANLANGYITATGYVGSASGLTAIPAANVTGTLPNAVTNAISNVGTVSAGAIAGAIITGNVANANMAYFANVSTNATTASAYIAFANGSTTSNYALQSNTAIFANLANGYMTATGFAGNVTGATGIFATSANAPLINSGTSNITLTSGGNISVYTNANSTAQLVVANGATNVPGAYVAGTLYTGGSNTAYGGYSTTRANVAVTSASAVTIDQFANTVYRAAKYVITASGTNGYQAIEALVVHDGTTAYATLYADIISNSTPGADVIDLTVSISSGNILVNAQANATFGSSANVRVLPMYVPV
jgi:hypothetical protein